MSLLALSLLLFLPSGVVPSPSPPFFSPISLPYPLPSSSVIWERGSYSRLSVSSDFSSSLRIGVDGDDASLLFSSSPPSPLPGGFALTSGNDGNAWGSYDELQLLAAPSGMVLYKVRYYASVDAFTFDRPAVADAFPWFSLSSAANASSVGAWSYLDDAMLRGSFFDSLDSCAATQLRRAAPGCDLTGAWTSPSAVAVVMSSNGSLSTTAAWGTGSGALDGLVANVSFSNVGPQLGAVAADCNSIAWSPAGSHWTRKNSPSAPSLSDGVLFVFSRSASSLPRASLVLSPLDNFSTQTTACGAGTPAVGSGFGLLTPEKSNAPAGARASGLLVGRPGLKRATIAAGALLRQRFATTRRRGAGTRALSYWSDNAAGYSFWSIAKNLSTWGVPEDLFKQLHVGYKALGIPIVQWEVDSNYIMGDSMAPFAGGWCWRDWRAWNTSFYPSGGQLSSLLGNASMAFYVSVFCNDTVHRAEGFKFVSVDGSAWGHAQVAVAHPDSSREFYRSILSTAREQWGMELLFTDFLCWRGDVLTAALPDTYGASEAWLGGMVLAAQDLGMEVQFCMGAFCNAGPWVGGLVAPAPLLPLLPLRAFFTPHPTPHTHTLQRAGTRRSFRCSGRP